MRMSCESPRCPDCETRTIPGEHVGLVWLCPKCYRIVQLALSEVGLWKRMAREDGLAGPVYGICGTLIGLSRVHKNPDPYSVTLWQLGKEAKE